jgi:FkbM family methyltransferase
MLYIFANVGFTGSALPFFTFLWFRERQMFAWIKQKIAHHKIKSSFKEYGTEIKEFDIPSYGCLKYAQWLNPCESTKILSEDKIGFFNKFVKKGDLAVDVGAHTGDTTLPLALAVGKQGTVLALEPNSVVYKILEQNVKLNSDKTCIVPLCVAATHNDGQFFYNSSEATFNNGGVSEKAHSRHGKFALPQKVQGINLGAYLTTNFSDKLGRFSFIKIDTEGYDFEVILSLSDVIDRVKPIIVAECFKKLPNKTRYSLFEYLSSKGYTIFHITDFTSSCEFTKMSKKDMTKWRAFDLCALPHGKSFN